MLTRDARKLNRINLNKPELVEEFESNDQDEPEMEIECTDNDKG